MAITTDPRVTGVPVPIYGANTLTVGSGGQFSDVQSAINAIAAAGSNLKTLALTGTVSVTNGSTAITFSTAPAVEIFALQDLLNIGGRYYQILEADSATGGTGFVLYEPYQGATNAAAAFTIERPNPWTILVGPQNFQFGVNVTAFTTIPFVHVKGAGKGKTIFQNYGAGQSANTNPLVGIAHGSVISDCSLISPDYTFQEYQMGLTAVSTATAQAMGGNRWVFRDCWMPQFDPNGDSTGDLYSKGQYWNTGDFFDFIDCEFSHEWDGFTPQPQGTQNATFRFIRPIIWKFPAPAYQLPNMTGATFFHAGVGNPVNFIFENPIYDQRTYAANEVVSSSFAGSGGSYGFLYNEGGSGIVISPTITMSINGCKSKFGGGITCSGATTKVIGGHVDVIGTPVGTVCGGIAADTVAGTVLTTQGVDCNFYTGPVLDNAQNIPYAATITPDASLGDRIIVGVLTGNILIDAPLHPQVGQKLVFSYTQDSTGGRTLSYASIFLASSLALGTAGQKAAQSFVYDGTNWVQDGGALVWV